MQQTLRFPPSGIEIKALKRRVESGDCTSFEALSGWLLEFENEGSQSSCRRRIEIVVCFKGSQSSCSGFDRLFRVVTMAME